jgi:diguanylate cyclase (GGDEF)-like protein
VGDPSLNPEEHGTGASNGQRERSTSCSDGLAGEPTLVDAEQTLADSEHTLGEVDRTGGERELTAAARLQGAHERDATAQARDLAGRVRDRAAATRDSAMAQRDVDDEWDGQRAVIGGQIFVRAADYRRRATDHRAQAAHHRAQAASDREAAGIDREQGARDRSQALVDREALARALAVSETDPLTGSRTWAAGLADLDRELDRCHSTNSTLVLVHIDVVGLERLTDGAGHAAGDRLLQRVVARITEHLRSYDLVIRHGDDEFLCAISNVTLHEARGRFSAIAHALAAGSEAGTIRTGFAALRPGESATELVGRADDQLVDSRHG